MRFRLKDLLDYYRLDSNCYSIEIYVTPMTKHDYFVLREKFRYYCKKKCISWIAVYSTTDSATAKQTVIHTGKRGRPHKIVQGVEVDGHIHNLFIGNANTSAYSTVHTIKQSIDKLYHKSVCKVTSKGRDIHAYNTMAYCFKQADTTRTGGDFDFKGYVKSHDFFG